MNRRLTVITLLAMNIGLVGTILVMVYFMKLPDRASNTVPYPHPVQNTVTQITVRKMNATNLWDEIERRARGWSAIESTNYLFYIRNLRNLGCPEQTIRDIIIADIAKLYNRQLQSVLANAPAFAFWQTRRATDPEWFDVETDTQIKAIEAERDQLVRDLLQVDYGAHAAKFSRESLLADRKFAFLPPEKRAAVVALVDAYKAQIGAIRDASLGVILPEEAVRIDALMQEQEAALAELLTPSEMLNYELIVSPLARSLRQNLNGFDPSPEEFTIIYQLQRSFDDIVKAGLDPNAEITPEAYEQAREGAEAALAEEMRDVLGDDRFASFQRVQDPDFQFLLNWTDRMQVEPSLVNQVYDMKLEAERRRQQIEANTALSFEDRQQAYQSIAAATATSVSELMGEDTYRQYRQSGGVWIDKLGQADLMVELIAPEIDELINEP